MNALMSFSVQQLLRPTTAYSDSISLAAAEALENGVLRSNRNGILKSPTDPRYPSILPDSLVDNRIHFALNCGAASCPPIKRFTAEAIEGELEVVAMAYCEGDENVRVEGGALWLNAIFNWYGGDFGGTDREKARWVEGWCGEEKARAIRELGDGVTVKYLEYDWGSDGIRPVRPYDPETCKLL